MQNWFWGDFVGAFDKGQLTSLVSLRLESEIMQRVTEANKYLTAMIILYSGIYDIDTRARAQKIDKKVVPHDVMRGGDS